MADLVLLLCGMFWLKLLLGYSFSKLLFIGVIPFIPGDMLKALVACAVYFKFKSRLKEVLFR